MIRTTRFPRSLIRLSRSFLLLCAAAATIPAPLWADTADTSSAMLSEFEMMQRYGPDMKVAVPSLIEGLKSPDTSIRRKSAFELGEIGPDAAPALDGLSHALQHDNDMEVRRNAAFALGEIGPPSIPILLQILRDPTPRIRRNVAAALVRIGPPAVPSLIGLLNSNKPIIRKNAASILGRIGPEAKSAVPALEAALRDEDKAFCWTVKQALKKIRQVGLEGLVEDLHNNTVSVRSNAAYMLGEMGGNAAPAIPHLIVCLKDENAVVRKNASFALAKIGKPAVPALEKALESPAVRTRKNAAFCLGELGKNAAPALPALRTLLTDSDKRVRWCAENAIIKISVHLQQP